MNGTHRFSGGVGPWTNHVGPDLEALRERFLNFTPKTRQEERYGMLSWEPIEQGVDFPRAVLSIYEFPGLGGALCWATAFDKDHRPAWWTLGDASKLSNEDWVPSEDAPLAGCFIPINRWLVAKRTTKSTRATPWG